MRRSKLQKVVNNRGELKIHFLGFIGLCTRVFQKTYDLNLNDFYRLAWMHYMKTFTKDDFEDYTTVFAWKPKAIKKFIEDGWIKILSEGERRKGQRNIYTTTVQCDVRFGKLYKQLTEDELLPKKAEFNKYFKRSVDWLNNHHKTKNRNNNKF